VKQILPRPVFLVPQLAAGWYPQPVPCGSAVNLSEPSPRQPAEGPTAP